MPDALATDCKKCSTTQKQMTEKVIKFLVENKREMWDKLVAKYDPDMKYRNKYEQDAKKIGLTV